MPRNEDTMAILGICGLIVDAIGVYYQKKAYELLAETAALAGQGPDAATTLHTIFYLALLGLFVLSVFLLLPKIKKLL